jgi:hypothetical protein
MNISFPKVNNTTYFPYKFHEVWGENIPSSEGRKARL